MKPSEIATGWRLVRNWIILLIVMGLLWMGAGWAAWSFITAIIDYAKA